MWYIAVASSVDKLYSNRIYMYVQQKRAVGNKDFW